MEAADQVLAAAPPPIHNNQPPIAKGKRTKRQRPHSPLLFTTPYNNNNNDDPTTTAAASEEEESTTTVEEDTARSLILLARGHFVRITKQPQNRGGDDEYDDERDSKRRRRPAESAVAAADGGACMYACKTCDRVFSSFQALGGHRASHKKPKLNEIRKPAINLISDEEDLQSPLMLSIAHGKSPPPTSVSLQLNNLSAAAAARTFPSPRMHICSYCGAEFTSGQALGGHMRRHRGGGGGASVEEAEEQRKPRNGLSLDLNLPAAAGAEDENQTIEFDSRQEKSAAGKFGLSTAVTSALVDCHF